MVDDGIIFLDKDDHERNYYLDCSTGLILVNDDGCFKSALYTNYSSQYDVFDAAYFRKLLSNNKNDKQFFAFRGNSYGEIKTIDFLGSSISEVFSVPIIEYEARTNAELIAIVDFIQEKLSESRFFEKLWFRGQSCEYINNISKDTIKKIGMHNHFTSVPSLIPSIGRRISKDNFDELSKQNMYWYEAFKIWTLTQSTGFGNTFSIGSPLYIKLIKNIQNPKEFARIVDESIYDISEYVFFQDYREQDPQMLSTQQYGGLSSMLDITDDLDVALFFTHSKLNNNNYQICEPTDDRIIYVFAQGRNTGTFDISNNVFFNATIDGSISLPLRIRNQKCGLLSGSNCTAKNSYAYRIIAKIRIKNPSILTTKKVNEMFPSISSDSLYKTYSDVEPKLKGLYG